MNWSGQLSKPGTMVFAVVFLPVALAIGLVVGVKLWRDAIVGLWNNEGSWIY